MDTKELLKNASVNFHWSRIPGKFVNELTGEEYRGPDGEEIGFDGSVREWYETLVETITDVSNSLYVHGLGRGDFIVVSPDIAMILRCSVLYKPYFPDSLETHLHQTCPTCSQSTVRRIGLCNRFVVYEDSNLPRNKALVGAMGESSGVPFAGSVTVDDLAVEEEA